MIQCSRTYWKWSLMTKRSAQLTLQHLEAKLSGPADLTTTIKLLFRKLVISHYNLNLLQLQCLAFTQNCRDITNTIVQSTSFLFSRGFPFYHFAATHLFFLLISNFWFIWISIHFIFLSYLLQLHGHAQFKFIY